MKTGFVGSLVAFVLCGFAANLLAGGFKSQVIENGTPLTITVPDGVFLKVRNFTQEGGTVRGVVTVTIMGQTTTSATVLAATIIEPQSPTPTSAPSALEPVNSAIIAGPATVTITAGDVPAFITYRKEKEPD